MTFVICIPKQVRENLLSKQQSIERSEKAKKLRAMRKFGKQVRHRQQFIVLVTLTKLFVYGFTELIGSD